MTRNMKGGGRATTVATCILGFLFASSFLTAHGQDPVTAGVKIAAWHAVASDLIEQGEKSGQVLIKEAGLEMQRAIIALEKALGDNVRKPLESLDATLRNEMRAAEYLMESIRISADAMPSCIGNEGSILIANTYAGLQSGIDAIPLMKGEPIAYVAHQAGGRSPYTVVRPKTEERIQVDVIGANMWGDNDVCEGNIHAIASPISGEGQDITVDVVSHSQERLTLALPWDFPKGKWSVSVAAERRATMMRCLWPDRETVATTFEVRDPTYLNVIARVTPVCKGYEEKVYPYVGQQQNGSRIKSESISQNFEINEGGWEYVGHSDLTIYNRRGDSGNVTVRRNGHGVNVIGSLNRKCNKCSAAALLHWTGTITYRRPQPPNPQPAILVEVPEKLYPGSSKAFKLDEYSPPESCDLERWALGGTVVTADGEEMAIADQIGLIDGSVISNGFGAKLVFNGVTRAGTAEVQGTGCLVR